MTILAAPTPLASLIQSCIVTVAQACGRQTPRPHEIPGDKTPGARFLYFYAGVNSNIQ